MVTLICFSGCSKKMVTTPESNSSNIEENTQVKDEIQLITPQITSQITSQITPQITPQDSYNETTSMVDLTQLSSTMVFAEVYNMMVIPQDYVGKTIKMQGQFAVYEDEATGNRYFAVIIADATACCEQGLEFVWSGEHDYPNDYPEVGATIEVTGEFQTYEENDATYCHLLTDHIVVIE